MSTANENTPSVDLLISPIESGADQWEVVEPGSKRTVGRIWRDGPRFAWQAYVPPAPTEQEARHRAELARQMFEQAYPNYSAPRIEITERRTGSWDWLVVYSGAADSRDVALEILRSGVAASRAWIATE